MTLPDGPNGHPRCCLTPAERKSSVSEGTSPHGCSIMPARATSIVVWLALAALLCESTYAFSLASVPGPIGMRRKTTALLRMCEPTSATAAATASDNLDADTAASCPSPLAPDGIAMATTTFERPFKGTSTLKKTWVDRSAATGLQFPANVFNSYGKRQLKLTVSLACA